jgi:Ran GTPase-activating protein (RanGAP) involved in mRNA processing and transport
MGNSTLESLIMQHNWLGSGCGMALGKLLDNNSTLLHVSLAWNVIGPNGAIGIAAGLTNNYSSIASRANTLAEAPQRYLRVTLFGVCLIRGRVINYY